MEYMMQEMVQTGPEEDLDTRLVGTPVRVRSIEDALIRTGADLVMVNRGDSADLAPFLMARTEEFYSAARQIWALSKPRARK